MITKRGRGRIWGGKDKDIYEPGTDPRALLKEFVLASRRLGLEPHRSIRESLRRGNKEENEFFGKQIIVRDTDVVFGPGDCRALTLALLGRGMRERTSVVYKALKDLRIWRSRIGDDGACAIARLLSTGGSELNLEHLELLEMNKTLLTLTLDFNDGLGSDGIAALCMGLRTNTTLKTLSVKHCAIDKRGGDPLGEMLSFPKLRLCHIDLSGNKLGGEGLMALCVSGLHKNKSLNTLKMADNNIASAKKDVDALSLFAKIASKHSSLREIDLLYNCIGSNGGTALLPIVANKKLAVLRIDTGLPDDLYTVLYRNTPKTKRKKKKRKASNKWKSRPT